MRPVFLTLFCLCLLLNPLGVLAQLDLPASKPSTSFDSNSLIDQVEFLPVEQAYVLNTEFESPARLRLNWQIADGYYLYRHGFEFKLTRGEQSLPIKSLIPEGIKKQDDYFGLVEVYYNNIDISLENIANLSGLTLTVTSQGCADAGLCYPPYSQQFQLDGQQATIYPAEQLLAGNSGSTSSTPFNTPSKPAGQAASSLAYMLLLAIIGGAILNLMPCVFPVLSLKVLSFANDKNHSQLIHGISYSAGVVISFVAVAAVLVALQSAGEAIGWGFQLQSPWFVAALAYLFFVMGLSLSGYIELGSQWMNTGDKLAAQPGYVGSFFTGILATVVASPCTAPFMGSALGYAATQTTAFALLVFAALGLGMALPVLILSCSPKLLKKLPKPGPWMEQLKQFLAFPLYATAVWLSWVVGKQTGVNGMAGLLLGCILIALAVWLWRGKIVQRTLASACAVLAIAIIAGPLLTPATENANNQPHYQAYSPNLLSSLRKQGKPVFINITADWCITCLANEKTTLGTTRVKAAMDRNGVTYLKADWTNRDPQITALLKQYGRSGIPLYIIYGQGNSLQGELLPQILTVDTMLDVLTNASKPAQLTTR